MTNSRFAMTGTRPVALAAGLLAAIAIAIAACGGTATPAPTAPTALPTATAAPSTAASPAGASPAASASAFGSAADRLDSLASYRFTVNIDSTAASRTQKIVMSGTVLNAATKSYALEMDNSGEKTSVVVIGSEAWVKQAGAAWQQLSPAMAQTFMTGLSAFRPEKLFATAFGMNSDKFTNAGDDTHNGIATVHYRGSDALSAVYGGLFGVQAMYASDVWVARDGGYLVGSEIRTSGASSSVAGSYSSIVNITNVNDASNKVERPT